MLSLSKNAIKNLPHTLHRIKKLHNTTDTSTRKRLIRAIEIEVYQHEHEISNDNFPEINSLIIGINFEREEQKKE